MQLCSKEALHPAFEKIACVKYGLRVSPYRCRDLIRTSGYGLFGASLEWRAIIDAVIKKPVLNY
jgi:hypothetical protein